MQEFLQLLLLTATADPMKELCLYPLAIDCFFFAFLQELSITLFTPNCQPSQVPSAGAISVAVTNSNSQPVASQDPMQ